ncbi:MAG TPA: HmuY family protein, partial [Bacteroidia bacterium]|nr:HmuY family protein [Bacteroidia bacterium]
FVSFERGVVAIEPPKADWDLCFSQYLEVLPEAYLVTGVLLNRHQTAAVMDSTLPFSAIDIGIASDMQLSNSLNVIGYAWKFYHFNSATYQVLPQMTYIIRDSEGHLYKLHFVDFYDAQGVKGSPAWEYQRL